MQFLRGRESELTVSYVQRSKSAKMASFRYKVFLPNSPMKLRENDRCFVKLISQLFCIRLKWNKLQCLSNTLFRFSLSSFQSSTLFRSTSIFHLPIFVVNHEKSTFLVEIGKEISFNVNYGHIRVRLCYFFLDCLPTRIDLNLF